MPPFPPVSLRKIKDAMARYRRDPAGLFTSDGRLDQSNPITSMAMGATNPMGTTAAAKIPGVASALAEKIGAAIESKAPQLSALARRGIEAWHGSPHKFDSFSLDKIGTGEGAQAYGHGLYFAESRPVAEIYRAMAEPSYRNAGVQSIVSDAIAAARKSGLDDNAARIAARNDIIKQAMERPSSLRQQWFDAANNLDGILDDPKAGSLYRVRLDVSPDELLDWDTPLSQQSENIRRAVASQRRGAVTSGMDFGGNSKIVQDADGKWWLSTHGGARFRLSQSDVDRLSSGATMGDDAIGSAAYQAIANNAGQLQASQLLDRAGVKGIRYLDGGSRAAGDGTRNYVIFDPERIQILERLAALGIGGETVRNMLARAKAQKPQQDQPTLSRMAQGATRP